MKNRLVLLILLLGLIVLIYSPTHATVLFEDGFETGDTSHVDGTSGAYWTTQQSGTGDSVTVSGTIPRTGSYSLKFHFNGDLDTGHDSWAEQRFQISTATRSEVYVRYYIWFPENYTIRNTPSTDNTKYFYIWGDSYANDMNKIGMEVETTMSAGFKAKQNYDDGVQLGCTNAFTAYMVDVPAKWTLTSGDKGKWLCFEWRYKIDSGAGDGAVQFWVDGDLKLSGTNLSWLDSPCGVSEFIHNGYLMGWSNSGFDEDTDVYIDDVVFSTEYIGPDDGTDPIIVMDNSGQTVESSPLASITGTATASSGRFIEEVTSSGLTIVCDDGTWGTAACQDNSETFTVTNTSLDEGLNTFTFVVEDDQTDTGQTNFTVTLETPSTDPVLVMDNSGETVDVTPLASITGTATASAGRTISGVTSPGLTVIPDTGWGGQVETFTVTNTDLDAGLNTFTFTATDNESDTDIEDFTVTYTVSAGCDSENPFLCLTQTPCESEGFYWWDSACRTIPEPVWMGTNLLTNVKFLNWTDGDPDDWDVLTTGANVTEVSNGVQLEGLGLIRQAVIGSDKTYTYAANLVVVSTNNLEVYHEDESDYYSEVATITGQFSVNEIFDHNIYFQAPIGSDVIISDVVVRESSTTQSNIQALGTPMGISGTGTPISIGN